MNSSRLQQHRSHEAGLSLVELMIAMTIGLIILGMVGSIFLGARQSIRYQEATGRLQENARFALDMMSYSVRNAGYLPCRTDTYRKFVNVVNSGTSNWWLNLAKPLAGYEGGVSTFPTYLDDAIAGTDALVTVGADAANEISVTSHVPASAVIHTTQHAIKPGAILLISNCYKTTMLQMTGPTNNNNNATTIVHNTGNNVQPGNCYQRLLKGCGDAPPQGETYQYDPPSFVIPLHANTFYIANSISGTGRSLWTTALNSAGGTTATELIEGVENLQLAYGEDTGADGVPDRYVTADSVTDWSKVITVRINLLMRSLEDGLTSTPQTYQFNGQTITATDRRLRRSYSVVVNLRNRSS